MTRALLLSSLGLLALILLGSLEWALGLHTLSIDLVLIIVLYLAMAEPSGPGGRQISLGGPVGRFDLPSVLAVFVLGYLADLFGGELKGVHSLALAVVFVGGRLLARQVYLAGPTAQIIVCFIGSLLASGVALLVRWSAGVSPSLPLVLVLLGQAGLTAVLAPPVMGLLRRLDGRLMGGRGEGRQARQLIVRG